MVPRLTFTRLGVRLLVLGITAQSLGLIVDAWLHLRDPGLAHTEALFTFSNPGHALLISGIGVGILGAFLVLAGPHLDRISSPRRRATIPLAVALELVAIGVFASHTELGAHHDPLPIELASHSHVSTVTATGDPASNQHGHGDALTGSALLDSTTEAKLELELSIARSVALHYPRLADALKAGYTQALDYGPGIGSHYMNYQQTFKPFDVAHPAMLLYNGDTPGSVVVGVMYYVYSGQGPPEAFAGHLDHWHQHPQTCVGLAGAQFSGDPEGARSCGHRGINAWMLHVWCVPGWESVLGTFSDENPMLL